MEKGKVSIIIGIILIIVLIFILAPVITKWQENEIATDCLRGSQVACVYFNAQENLVAEKLQLQEAQIQLQEARATLQIAKEAYKTSLEATPTNVGGE